MTKREVENKINFGLDQSLKETKRKFNLKEALEKIIMGL